MISFNRRWLRGFVVVIVCLPRALGAQTVWHPVGSATHAEDGDERLKWSLTGASGPSVMVGQDIMVVEEGRKPLKVRIVEIRPEGLVTMYKGQARQIPTTRVTQIQRGDSLKNGALIGFLVGTGFALNRLGSCEINCYGAFVPVLGGMGAGIGSLVDAMKRSTTLYIASDRVGFSDFSQRAFTTLRALEAYPPG